MERRNWDEYTEQIPTPLELDLTIKLEQAEARIKELEQEKAILLGDWPGAI